MPKFLQRTISPRASRMRLAGVVSILVFLGLTAPAFAGLRIGTITVNRQNIFDTARKSESLIFGPIVNTIHIVTRERVIRDELLYREGEPLRIDLIKETERNLRSLGFIGDITTTLDTLRDSTVNVTVHTRDKWTLNVSPSYQQGGGERKMSFVAKDNNFLGNGQSLSLSYDYRSERDYPHGNELIFSERRLFGSRWGSTMRIHNAEEMRLRGVSFDRPFYSEEAPWAASVFIQQGEMELRRYEDGVSVDKNAISQQYLSGYYARSYGDRVKIRPAIAYIHASSSGDEQRTFDNLNLVNLSLNLMRRTYFERLYLNNHGRVEDVAIGYMANITLGRNFRSNGNHPEHYLQLSWQHALFGGEDYYLGYNATYSTFLGGSDARERTLILEGVQYYQLPYSQTLTGRILGVFGDNWSSHRQVILGNLSGLRGYPNFALSGQRELLYNIEHRLFSRGQIWIFHFGAVAFLDGGTTWNQGQRLVDQRFHHSAGLGLRIENTKQQGAGVIRIDFAYNFDEKRFAEVIISSNVLFSAFRDFTYMLPTRLMNF